MRAPACRRRHPRDGSPRLRAEDVDALRGVRAVGKTADEALSLWQKFQTLEEMGAFAVERELIPAKVMSEINKRTGMATISLGSGPDADVMCLFTSDICEKASGCRAMHVRTPISRRCTTRSPRNAEGPCPPSVQMSPPDSSRMPPRSHRSTSTS
jgi:hypothetical protein